MKSLLLVLSIFASAASYAHSDIRDSGHYETAKQQFERYNPGCLTRYANHQNWFGYSIAEFIVASSDDFDYSAIDALVTSIRHAKGWPKYVGRKRGFEDPLNVIVVNKFWAEVSVANNRGFLLCTGDRFSRYKFKKLFADKWIPELITAHPELLKKINPTEAELNEEIHNEQSNNHQP